MGRMGRMGRNFEVCNAFARGDHAQPAVVLGQPGQQRSQGFVPQFAGLRTGRMLERLQTVQHQQRTPPRDQFGQPRSLCPRPARGCRPVVGPGRRRRTSRRRRRTPWRRRPCERRRHPRRGACPGCRTTNRNTARRVGKLGRVKAVVQHGLFAEPSGERFGDLLDVVAFRAGKRKRHPESNEWGHRFLVTVRGVSFQLAVDRSLASWKLTPRDIWF